MKHFHEQFTPANSIRLKNLWEKFVQTTLISGVVIVAVVLIVSFLVRLDAVQKEVDTLIGADRDQGLWAATQIQVELLEFEKLVKSAETTLSTSESEVRADFDILYSRLSQVLDPNIANVFRANGKFSIPTEIINLRDRMAAVVDLNDRLGPIELAKLSTLSMKAHHLWKQSIGLVLQETREYKVSVRQQAVDTLRSVKVQLWIALAISTAIPILIFIMMFLHKKFKQARSHTLVDTLTGCASRAGLREALLTRFGMAKAGFSVAVVDINDLKMVNDRYGHQVGDLLIQNVGMALNKVTRGIDCTARIGGDEFFVVLDATIDQAELILNRAQEHLQKMSETGKYGIIPMQISFGVAHCADIAEFDDAISLADQRMYRRKQASKTEESPLLTTSKLGQSDEAETLKRNL